MEWQRRPRHRRQAKGGFVEVDAYKLRKLRRDAAADGGSPCIDPDAMHQLEKAGLAFALDIIKPIPRDFPSLPGMTAEEAGLRDAVRQYRERLNYILGLLSVLRDPQMIGVNGDTAEDCERWLRAVDMGPWTEDDDVAKASKQNLAALTESPF